VARVWANVLKVERVGRYDNFFELGGHSLIAIDLTIRIRKACNAAIPVTGLLECPTIRQLAVLVDAPVAGPDEPAAGSPEPAADATTGPDTTADTDTAAGTDAPA
jgi:acyl carrier protein